jgi:hypothetical protein
MFTAIAKVILQALWTACAAIYWTGYAIMWAIDLLKYPLHPYVLVPLVAICYSVYYFRITEKDIQCMLEPRKIDVVTADDIEVLIVQPNSLISAVVAHLLTDGAATAAEKPAVQIISIYSDSISTTLCHDVRNKVVCITGIALNPQNIDEICKKAAKVVIAECQPQSRWPTLTEHYKSGKLVNLCGPQNTHTSAQALWKFLRPNSAPEPIIITYLGNNLLPHAKYVNEYLATNFRAAAVAPKNPRAVVGTFIDEILKYGGVTIQDIAAHFKTPGADKKHLPKPLYDMVRLIKQGKSMYDATVVTAKQLPYNIQTVARNGRRYSLCTVVTIEAHVNVVADVVIAAALEKQLSDPVVAAVMYYDLIMCAWVITYIAADKATNVLPFVGVKDPHMFSDRAMICDKVPVRYM